MKSTPTQVSSYTNLVWSSRSILSCTRNLNTRPVYASQIKKLRKRFFGGTSYLVGQFLHPSAVHVQSSRSIQYMQKVQLFLNIFFILHWQFGYGTSLCFTDHDTQREIFGGTSSLVGQFLHPSPVQSSRSIQRIQTVQLFLNKFFFSCAGNLECGTSQCFTDQETQEEIFGGTSSLVGQLLHPSPVQSSRSIQPMNTVQLVLNKFLFVSSTSNLDVGPVYASQIKKLRRDFWWNQLP